MNTLIVDEAGVIQLSSDLLPLPAPVLRQAELRQCFARGWVDWAWEQAIEQVEDRIMPLAAQVPPDQNLCLQGAWRAWDLAMVNAHPVSGKEPKVWTVAEIEAVFNASLGAHGGDRLSKQLGAQAEEFAAQLTLVRECLHHWRQNGVLRGADARPT